jgi:hypothetical protein
MSENCEVDITYRDCKSPDTERRSGSSEVRNKFIEMVELESG